MALPNVRTAFSGFRIAHVSDCHFRRWDDVTEAAQDILLSLQYDLLVATGDFGGGPRHAAKAAALFVRFFEPLTRRGPVYAVWGNHDAELAEALQNIPLEVLNNRAVSIERSGGVLHVAGVDQRGPGSEDLAAALQSHNNGEPTILLAHYPSTVHRLQAGSVDLVLCGHTHGGQIRLPGIGCLWTNDRIARRLARGLHRVAGTRLFVTAGIGVSSPVRVRVNCPPEVAVLTLQPVGPSAP